MRTRTAPLLAGTLLAVATPLLAAQNNAVVKLWPGKAPGEQGEVAAETFEMGRLTNVSDPTLTVFPSTVGKAPRPAVLIAPGGAYQFLSWDLEGTEVARKFNEFGVTAFVFKYRVPRRASDPESMLPLMDAQRAMSLVRSRAKEWEVDPTRLGFLGFSAGGHLAANLSTNFDRRAYDAVDDADRASCRPDFAVLIYPGGILDRQDPSRLAASLPVTAAVPPSFVAVASDDKGSGDSSIRYFLALRSAGVKSELHVYASGGHGFGIRPRAGAAATWPDRCAEWLRGIGILPPP